MDDIQFCSFCGKIVELSYNYCPYCGTQMKDILHFETIVENSFREVEKVRMIDEISRLKKLEGVLKELEDDLNIFLSVKSS
jgi:hypothetical protein